MLIFCKRIGKIIKYPDIYGSNALEDVAVMQRNRPKYESEVKYAQLSTSTENVSFLTK